MPAMIRRLFLPTAALALTAGRLFGQHDMHAMNAQPGLVAARQGSGTSWIPEASAHPALSRMAGAWTLSLHGAAFERQGGAAMLKYFLLEHVRGVSERRSDIAVAHGHKRSDVG